MELTTRGTGTPVLAIHGWTPDHRLMLGCLEPLFAGRPGYRRLYPDLPGMGRSPAPPGIDSTDDVLAALESHLDEWIGDEPYLVVGESYGGYLARALANRHQHRVLGLALLCPIGTAVKHAERTLPAHVTLRADPALADADPGFLEMAVVRTPETLRRFQTEIQPGLDTANATALARIGARYALSTPPESGLPYARPTLILTGRQDSATGYADQYALLPHYPRATYAVLDVAGHNLQIEQPALFEALMHEWLDRVAESS
ncbi:alpha/beta fold hydrolase [Dactylosporangium sp. CA-233914]|uniref:alpha/beta fold hydrolase n=1 Tax=Dactylosporangium sp. CA-233914 TaxID=3239934 RepID=UPI003D9198C7